MDVIMVKIEGFFIFSQFWMGCGRRGFRIGEWRKGFVIIGRAFLVPLTILSIRIFRCMERRMILCLRLSFPFFKSVILIKYYFKSANIVINDISNYRY